MLQIKDAKTFFWWMDECFLPNYYPVLEYNGKRLHWSVRQFVTDGVSFRVGPAMLRQLRSKTGKLCPCEMINFISRVIRCSFCIE